MEGRISSDDEHDGLAKEVGVEMAELAQIQRTIRLIEQLKWAKVCLFPGQRVEHEDGISDFTGCIRWLGECEWLIFCEPHRTAEQAHKLILDAHGRMLEGIRLSVLAPPRDGSWVNSLLHGDALFPSLTPEWLPKLLPEMVPAQKAPDREKLWGLYTKLDLEAGGQRRPLDVLHLSLADDAIWTFFLQIHGIKVARVIADPPGL